MIPSFSNNKTEQEPFRYPIIIEVRKGSRNHLVLLVGISILAVVMGIIILIVK